MNLELTESQVDALRLTLADDYHRCRKSADIYAAEAEHVTDPFLRARAQADADHFTWRRDQLVEILAALDAAASSE